MIKMRAETPSNPQQSGLEMESNGSRAVDAATTTGDAGITAAGRMISGCVFVIFTAGFVSGTGFGRIVMRAVSFFGPGETPKLPGFGTGVTLAEGAGGGIGAKAGAAGFGKGCNMGDGGDGCVDWTGGRRNEVKGVSAAGSRLTGDGGVNAVGGRLGGRTGVREGRTIRAVSRLGSPFCGSSVGSGRGGSAMRTVSFFGSAITTTQVARRKIAEISFFVTR